MRALAQAVTGLSIADGWQDYLKTLVQLSTPEVLCRLVIGASDWCPDGNGKAMETKSVLGPPGIPPAVASVWLAPSLPGPLRPSPPPPVRPSLRPLNSFPAVPPHTLKDFWVSVCLCPTHVPSYFFFHFSEMFKFEISRISNIFFKFEI